MVRPTPYSIGGHLRRGGFGKSALAAKVYGDATGFDGKLWANFQYPKPFGTFALWLIQQVMGTEKYAAVREVYERQSDADLLREALNQLAQKRVLLVMDIIRLMDVGSRALTQPTQFAPF